MSIPHPGVDLGERSERPRIPRPQSLGRQERFCLQFSLYLAAGWSPRWRGPNRCGAAAALRPARRGERDRLKAWPLCTNPEVDRNQCWRRNLRVQEPRAQVDLKLMFDPSRDLCLMLAPQGFQARANLALDQGRS